MYPYDILPQGLDLVRVGIARALAKHTNTHPRLIASQRWGAKSVAFDYVMKAAVGGNDSDSAPELLASAGAVAAEFLAAVAPLTILGKLQGLRRVPVNAPFVATSAGAIAYWVRQNRAAPVSKGAFYRDHIESRKLAALVVFANALLENTSPAAEAMIRADLLRACAFSSDLTFIDESNGGSADEKPASVTYGAASVAATGDLADDLDALVGAFGGSLETASFVMHPRLAVQIALKAGSGGLGCDLGAKGGTLAGLPTITSESCTYDTGGGTIALIDAGGVCICDEGADIRESQAATIEMADDPTGATDTPAAMTKQFVSLFQSDSSAMIVSRSINWKLGRADSVAILTGASYGMA